MVAADGGFADACGVVDVNRVASVADRAIGAEINVFALVGTGSELGKPYLLRRVFTFGHLLGARLIFLRVL